MLFLTNLSLFVWLLGCALLVASPEDKQWKCDHSLVFACNYSGLLTVKLNYFHYDSLTFFQMEKKKQTFMTQLCKLIRLFFSLRQIWNDYRCRHSFEMIAFLSEKPAGARPQTDLGFSDRQQTGTCHRYTWNSSDSSAPKTHPRLFLAAMVKNKGSVLLLCMHCNSISRREKKTHGVGGVSNSCLRQTNCAHEPMHFVVPHLISA